MGDYFIEHDDVLANKLGIQDPLLMKEAEAAIVPLRMAELLASFHPARFDFACLCQIHEKLFSDLYPVAGKVRTVDLAKGGSAFCYVQFIAQEQQRIFKALQQKEYLAGLERNAFVRELAALAGDLNALHPFREGNGRAIRCFLTLLAQHCGYALTYSKVSTDELLEADIAAFNGRPGALEAVYNQIIE